MNIYDLKNARRRVLQDSKDISYTPKKRWDQGSFGSQRLLLLNHVQNTLRQHQNDGYILQKFKKEAEQLKQRKRREKFPHLYPPQNIIQNRSQYFPPYGQNQSILYPGQKIKNKSFSPEPQMRTIQKLNTIQTQIQPQLIYPVVNPVPNYIFQLEARIQYQRALAQKDLQLFKRQEKIKKQRMKIDNLYKQLKYRQKEDELQKYIKYQNEIKRMNKALNQVEKELSVRKFNYQERKNSQDESQLANRQKKNKSQILLSYGDGLPAVSRLSENKTPKYQNYQEEDKNPQIMYSPITRKKKSNVFQSVNLYNPVVKLSQTDGHLQELINYNKKLQYFNGKNSPKLMKIK